jgi:hypothetical protein
MWHKNIKTISSTSTLMIILFMLPSVIRAQVGIGTTNPTSELEIATSASGIPALELNPQTAPVGTATGQLAVVGNDLFMYDVARSKWLSVENTVLQFGRSGNSVNTQTLRCAGNVGSAISAPLMPFKGTIVRISSITSANATKQFELRVRKYDTNTNTTTTEQSFNFNLSDFEYVNNNLNIDFNENDFITIRGRGTDDASNPVIVLWIKWRQ